MKRRLRDELQQSKPFETPEEEAFLEIQRTAQVTMRWVSDALKPTGITPPQFNVLRILRGAQPGAVSCGGICERMVTHDPDLTRLVDRLEAAGLVAKSRDGEDRRVVNVRITKAGEKAVQRASVAVTLALRENLGSVGARKLGTLTDLLELARGPS
jgi:DNA-binding MarR family transcriptional regulator